MAKQSKKGKVISDRIKKMQAAQNLKKYHATRGKNVMSVATNGALPKS